MNNFNFILFTNVVDLYDATNNFPLISSSNLTTSFPLQTFKILSNEVYKVSKSSLIIFLDVSLIVINPL